MSSPVDHVVDIWLFSSADNSRNARRKLRRNVLAEYLNIEPDNICFEKEAHGRPVLHLSHKISLSFNESHSIDSYGIAVCRAARVGFDIETIRELSDISEWADQACPKEELSKCENLPPDQFAAALLRQWVRREAILKAWGVGLTYNPRQIDLSTRRPDTNCRNASVSIEGMTAVFSDIESSADIIGAVALQDNSRNFSIRYKTLNYRF